MLCCRWRRCGGLAEPIDERTCVLATDSETPLASIAVHLDLFGVGFTVTDPPELRAHLSELASRYQGASQ